MKKGFFGFKIGLRFTNEGVYFMSADINSCNLTGRMTKDVEIKAINSSFLVSGSFAANRNIKKGDKWEEEASYFNFKLWVKSDKQKDFYSNYLKKGTQIAIHGELVQERWEKDGQKQSAVVLYAERIVPSFAGSGNSENTSSDKTSSGVPSFSNSEGFPEDVPF